MPRRMPRTTRWGRRLGTGLLVLSLARCGQPGSISGGEPSPGAECDPGAAVACDNGGASGGDTCVADCGPSEASSNCATSAQECGSARDGDDVVGDVLVDDVAGDDGVVDVGVDDGCGDGVLDETEACDDGNHEDADGCSGDCSTAEPGFACAVPGEPCEVACGNGVLDPAEQCDDGANTGAYGTCMADCTVAPFCGDGLIAIEHEDCDDANALGADGCSSTCVLEEGYACHEPGQPCERVATCGNGHLEAPEACDDGNTTARDGCSADCSLVEPGFVCPGAGEPCALQNTCGNGVWEDWEACDDGNRLDGDGCRWDCSQAEPGFVCILEGTPCVSLAECGNGQIEDGEACDDGDGNDRNDCTNHCQGPACGDGITWDEGSGVEQCDDGNQNDQDGCTNACRVATCGDGLVWSEGEGTESCDDGNQNDHDDCTNACRVATCGDGIVWSDGEGTERCDDGVNSGEYGTCKPDCTPAGYCGDGHVDWAAESCDDGINDGSYGTCEADCTPAARCGDGTVDASYEACDDARNDGTYGTCTPSCRRAPYCGDGVVDPPYEVCDNGVNDGSYGSCRSTCRLAPYCGDGLLTAPPEVCDDGGSEGNDGCGADCLQIEDGYSCPSPGEPCQLNCGNGRFDPSEGCDDGNRSDGDGCAGDCSAVEQGYTCPGPGLACELDCGNGVKEPSESCDDGNRQDGDGCAADCSVVEPDYECPVPGTPCNLLCGNGALDASEQCDNGINDGSYGTCNPDCSRAPYCGDATADPEEGCDQGTLSNDGRYGGCRADCTLSPHCGDGLVTHAEQCDDGDALGEDGCDASCQLEPGYICRTVGADCDLDWCGNGVVDPAEACDDGGRCGDGVTPCTTSTVDLDCPAGDLCTPRSTDGCDATCSSVEQGWDCPTAGEACVAAQCGDGLIAGLEVCDDGNVASLDGCSRGCVLEPGYKCPTPGQPCVGITCGDGLLEGLEECDDGGTDTGDGCDGTCHMEPPPTSCPDGWSACHWACPVPGQPCEMTECGDGVLLGTEECDDGNTMDGDGCDGTCYMEPPPQDCADGWPVCHWSCPVAGEPCEQTECGDAVVRGTEQCDDGKQCDDLQTRCEQDADCVDAGAGTLCAARAGDGCDPMCRQEPIYTCRAGFCAPVCGDGVTMWPYEACDDGNVSSGDGCSAACTVENGYACTDFDLQSPPTLDIDVTVRDFRGYDEQGVGDGYPNGGRGHPDFERYGCCKVSEGLVEPFLNAEHKPVLARLADPDNVGDCWCTDRQLTSSAWFDQWYRDVESVNRTTSKSLTLTGMCVGTPSGCADLSTKAECDGLEDCRWVYRFDSAPDGGYFPIDGELYGNTYGGHNFGFTTEFHAYFRYAGGERLDFTGDDDVWVFINNRLAVDLGGLHPAQSGSVTLSDVPESGCQADVGVVCDPRFDIYEGGVYEISFFHAERHTNASNYRLTLADFLNTGTASCDTLCGDGYLRGAEQCDDGGRCEGDDTACFHDADCQPGDRCTARAGDGCDAACQTEPGWVCDEEPSVCYRPVCGDGVTELPEACDDGGMCSGTAASCTADADCPQAQTCVSHGGDGCSSTCELESCGNGTADPGEACDDGNDIDADGCTNRCREAVCGDRVVWEGHEACDLGTADSARCDYDDGVSEHACTAVRCGDGYVNLAAGEVCDDGVNNGAYGSCTWDCRARAPFCGDGIVDPAHEQCDDGVNNGTYGTCMPETCDRAPHCGDGVIDAPFEACDDGADNDGSPGGCSPDCSYAAYCGDGIVTEGAGEQCDDGVNDGSYGGCMGDCTRAPFCGDGTTTPPFEQCDDMVNSGAYGTCTSDCSLAPRCGDGVVQVAEAETCDDGINDGSYGGCNPDCSTSGRCGDGTVDAPAEQCDDGVNSGDYDTCNSDCSWPARCGDSQVQVEHGELCDDGVNDGTYGGCTPQCTDAAHCGDAEVDESFGETCDDGTNDGTYGTCRPSCQPAPYCGDGQVDAILGGEACDGTALGGRRCSDLDGDGVREPGDFDGGELTCSSDCSLGVAGCYGCGDGVRNGVEACDGVGLCGQEADCGGLSCEDLGFRSVDGLRCLSSCALDLSGCDTLSCGNGSIDGAELCDGGDLGGRSCNDLDGDGVTGEPGDLAGGQLGCTTDCTLDISACEYCGDGVKNGTELCDGQDTGSASCQTLDLVGGTLTCNATCDGYDTSGCHECNDCTQCGMQACIDHRCGSCRTSSDCCAPLLCVGGECRLF